MVVKFPPTFRNSGLRSQTRVVSGRWPTWFAQWKVVVRLSQHQTVGSKAFETGKMGPFCRWVCYRVTYQPRGRPRRWRRHSVAEISGISDGLQMTACQLLTYFQSHTRELSSKIRILSVWTLVTSSSLLVDNSHDVCHVDMRNTESGHCSSARYSVILTKEHTQVHCRQSWHIKLSGGIQ